ncbi:Acid shock protein [Apilactobacillus kunkeei]|uniref:Molecular chaperone n=1 Tax=Apilactobacillus kunkeei TaxID=148814 RepID=A0AAC8WBA0_9LACO|nr:Hsp20/alpha crystallin family protein [Apilactobacillus kunkeei]ALJ31121.1 molecular chaperone [Apilactobacillus kunkeei]KFJ15516.1 molecular chaperone [Apilactobacillus kunkeei]UZX33322.1 Hsp20/alpha crystallin family protein [Apilactobacillus kunkeei]CAI2554094.1 Acid shock protein [Apilactobacillus kunkeei]CAI2554895.1 Acid shock protein [Apilactobacillus kunkeei]
MANELRNNVFNDFMDPMSNFFDGLGRNMVNSSKMKTDVIENDDEFEVKAELPGFKKEDININYENDTLTIHAIHDLNKEQKDEDGKLIRSERTSSDVSRSFYLPDADTDKIVAKYDGGILDIMVPKSAEKESKHTISIN